MSTSRVIFFIFFEADVGLPF